MFHFTCRFWLLVWGWNWDWENAMSHIKQFSTKLFSGICIRFGNTGKEKSNFREAIWILRI